MADFNSNLLVGGDHPLTTATALEWLGRWDRQQEHYIPDREERFAVIGDVLEATARNGSLTVVDLGVGPGSLAVRLLDRFAGARVVGVDADRLLLGLAARAYGDRPGLSLVEADLRSPAWPDSLGLNGTVDGVVSTTALHWLTRDELASVYASAASLLRPGGVLVNGDHLYDRPVRPALAGVARFVGDRRADRAAAVSNEHPGAGATRVVEDWDAWWSAVRAAPELASLVRRRDETAFDHPSDPGISFDDHLVMLSAAGFSEVGTVWQHGDDRVLVAIR